jgi:hypothetical protein
LRRRCGGRGVLEAGKFRKGEEPPWIKEGFHVGFTKLWGLSSEWFDPPIWVSGSGSFSSDRLQNKHN